MTKYNKMSFHGLKVAAWKLAKAYQIHTDYQYKRLSRDDIREINERTRTIEFQEMIDQTRRALASDNLEQMNKAITRFRHFRDISNRSKFAKKRMAANFMKDNILAMVKTSKVNEISMANTITAKGVYFPTRLYVYGVKNGHTGKGTNRTVWIAKIYIPVGKKTFTKQAIANAIFTAYRNNQLVNYYTDTTITTKPLLLHEKQGRDHMTDVVKKHRDLKIKLSNASFNISDIFTSSIQELIQDHIAGRDITNASEILVRETKSIQNEMGGGENKYHCALVLAAKSDPLIMKKIQPDEYYSNDAYITVEKATELYRRYNIPHHLVLPSGEEVATMLKKKTTRNKTVYGCIMNGHIYPIDRATYKLITKKKKVNLTHAGKGGEIIYRDTPDLYQEIMKLYNEDNYLPVFVKTQQGKITAYRIGEKLYQAMENFEQFQKIKVKLGFESKLVIPSAAGIARALINRFGLPQEHIYEGPIHDSYFRNNLEPAYYCCDCPDCEKRDDFPTMDISGCYWNILIQMKTLPVPTAFDKRIARENITDEDLELQTNSFFMIESLPEVCNCDYNFRWLDHRLMKALCKITGENVWKLVKFYWTPSMFFSGDVFRQIDAEMTKHLEPREQKLVRNTITGLLGQLIAKDNMGFLSVDKHVQGCVAQVLENGGVFLHRRIRDKYFSKAHNRAIYMKILSHGHAQVLELASKMLYKHGGHVHKIKVDEVSINPSEERGQNIQALNEDLTFEVHKNLYVRKPIALRKNYPRRFRLVKKFRDVIQADKYINIGNEWLFVHAPARMGKSYFIEHILQLDDKTTLYATPSRAASSNIDKPNVCCIQKVMAYNVQVDKKINTVVVDEVSMFNPNDKARLMYWASENHIRLIFSGDYGQISDIDQPVDCSSSEYYKEKFVLITLPWKPYCAITKDKYAVMTKWRNNEISISELGSYCEDQKPGQKTIHLYYTNKMVNRHNDSISNPIFFKTVINNKNHPNGLRLIKQGNLYYNFDNGTEVIIYHENEIKPLHASTVHSFQGSDVENPFENIDIHLVIHYRGFTREMLYTAITRTPGFKFTLIGDPEATFTSQYQPTLIKPRHIVYKYENPNNTVVEYIGITDNMKRRDHEHKKVKELPYEPVVVSRWYSRAQARRVERELIKTLKPRLNVQHNRDEPVAIIKAMEETEIKPNYIVYEKQKYIKYKHEGKWTKKRFNDKNRDDKIAEVEAILRASRVRSGKAG